MRRWVPVVALLVLAPWVGEYLLGNISLREIGALPFLVPLYGAGALLVRELARRTGRGWPTILLLGAAYGVVEAGLVDQSLFNPAFEGWDFQAVTPVPALGISAWNAWTFVVGHAVWSIAVPIAVVELWTRSRTPWLGRRGLVVTATGYALGCLEVFWFVRLAEGFVAAPGQLAGAAVVAAVLVAAAFAVPRPREATGDARMPRPGLVGLGAFIGLAVYVVRPETWGGFVFGIAWLAALGVLLVLLARRRGWDSRHELAVVAAALAVYAGLGYVLTLLTEPHDPVRWAGNVLWTVLAFALVLALRARERKAVPQH